MHRLLCWFILLLISAGTMPEIASAQTSISDLFAPWRDGNHIEASADAAIMNAAHVTTGGNSRFQLSSYESAGRWEMIDTYPINPTVGYQAMFLDIHSNDRLLPKHLLDSSIGFATPLGKAGEWFYAASAAIGYAGDSPFHQGDGVYGKASVILGRELSPGRSLVIGLDYDGSRVIFPDVPLPGVAYTNRLNENLSLTLGFPFTSINWIPFENAEIEIDYEAPLSMEAQASYKVTKHFEIFGRLRSIAQGFHSDSLPANRRIFFDQERAEAGVRWEPTNNLGVSLAGGYGFQTKFSTGFDENDEHTLARASDAAYLSLGLNLRF